MNTTVEQVCARIYDAALEEYGDAELAAVVASTVLTELLLEQGGIEAAEEAA